MFRAILIVFVAVTGLNSGASDLATTEQKLALAAIKLRPLLQAQGLQLVDDSLTIHPSNNPVPVFFVVMHQFFEVPFTHDAKSMEYEYVSFVAKSATAGLFSGYVYLLSVDQRIFAKDWPYDQIVENPGSRRLVKLLVQYPFARRNHPTPLALKQIALPEPTTPQGSFH